MKTEQPVRLSAGSQTKTGSGKKSAIVRREGHVLVERADGSSHTLENDVELTANPWPLTAIVNVRTELAEVLVISR